MAIVPESMHEMVARTAQPKEQVAWDYLMAQTEHVLPTVRVMQMSHLRPGEDDMTEHIFDNREGWDFHTLEIVPKYHPSLNDDLLEYCHVGIHPHTRGERGFNTLSVTYEEGMIRVSTNDLYTAPFRANVLMPNDDIIRIAEVRKITLYQGDELIWRAFQGVELRISAVNVPFRMVQPNVVLDPRVQYRPRTGEGIGELHKEAQMDNLMYYADV